MLVTGVVRRPELVVGELEDTELLDTDVVVRVECILLVPSEDTDDLTSVVVCPAAVLEVGVTWLVLVRSDEVDPGVVLIWLPLLTYVDEDKPGALVVCVDPAEVVIVVRSVLIVYNDPDEPGTVLCSVVVVWPVVIRLLLVVSAGLVLEVRMLPPVLLVCTDTDEETVTV